MTEIFDRVAHRCTRSEAIADGLLVDLTEWASADTDAGMVYGFVCAVAVSAGGCYPSRIQRLRNAEPRLTR